VRAAAADAGQTGIGGYPKSASAAIRVRWRAALMFVIVVAISDAQDRFMVATCFKPPRRIGGEDSPKPEAPAALVAAEAKGCRDAARPEASRTLASTAEARTARPETSAQLASSPLTTCD
jgi:hypothetical protein